MTNEQILKKAIKKAVRNGWDPDEYGHKGSVKWELKVLNEYWIEDHVTTNPPQIPGTFTNIYKFNTFHYIFSHNFAKAFWGEEEKCIWSKVDGRIYKYQCMKCGNMKDKKIKIRCENSTNDYQFYLQQMVLEKDPIKYLEKFL